ncbi:hypothetical protein GUJ93_ZPchr0001g32737 [Zizania palustris]|uniref:Uncharacterized protein n=1 Tax=Zizania palustris TaxID=103762 RepID=A0A8J5V0D9_ZIZPA|nr:hypothetical protein GUJ93_ZPchr0001g32737 [Zizania palustris]
MVNRLQAMLNVKDATAIVLWGNYNAWLVVPLDHDLIPPWTWIVMMSLVPCSLPMSLTLSSKMLFTSPTASLAHLPSSFDALGGTLQSTICVSYSKPGHHRYALISHVFLSMFDCFDSY